MRRLPLVLLAGLLGLCCPYALLAQDCPPGQDEEQQKRCFLSGELVGYWVKPAGLSVPLVTTGTGPNAGGLQDPNTAVLFDANRLNFNPSFGVRGELAYGFLPGLTGSIGGFYVGEEVEHFTLSSDANGNPFLLRPFFNAETGNPNAGVILAAPGLFAGGINIKVMRRLFGAEANLTCGLVGDVDWQLSCSVGARYMHLYESLDILDRTTPLLNDIVSFNLLPLAAGDEIRSLDQFTTRNQFAGGQGGLFLETRYDKFWFGVGGKLALGGTHQDIFITGFSTATSSRFPPVALGTGTLALSTNIGHHSKDAFSAILDFDLKVGYEITRNLRGVFGYQVINWTQVVRATDNVPSTVSDFLQPTSPFFGRTGQQVPQPSFSNTNLLIHAVHLGLELRY